MRLICPNCDAEYEVSDDAIPPGGRDVQCSNCQLSWFQTEKPTIPGREGSAPEPAEREDATSIADEEPATPEPEVVTPASEDTADEAAPQAPAAPTEPQRRPLDDAVANILREEASLGTAAPVAAASAMQKPPATEAAKPAAPVKPDETRQRIAQMTEEEGGTRAGAQPAAQSAAASDEAHMRTVPSINEINATLRARAQANDTSGLTEDEKEEAVQRKGFRRGFFWVLILFAILILPYIFADQIVEALPQTSDIMASYVMKVDQLRLALSEFVSSLTAN